MAKKKIAIACQGGGSHTAFTAGVLKSFYEKGVFKKYDVVSFSGTSGGAICAAIAWYSLLADKSDKGKTMAARLDNFWLDNSTNDDPVRSFQNTTLVNYRRMAEMLGVGDVKLNPSSNGFHMLHKLCKMFDSDFYDFEDLIRNHLSGLETDGLKTYVKSENPVLLVSSANVLTSESTILNSSKDEINIDSLLASAAIPSLFEPVEINKQYYWDGLYSLNPPIVPLTEKEHVGKDRIPDEIWVIQINPVYKNKLPENVSDLDDRINEMIGNMSLLQGLDHMKNMNEMLENKAFTEKYIRDQNLKITDLYLIQMSNDLQKNLDLPSKLDRSKSFITNLMRDGMRQGTEFLQNKKACTYPGKQVPHDRPVKSKREENTLDTIEEINELEPIT